MRAFLLGLLAGLATAEGGPTHSLRPSFLLVADSLFLPAAPARGAGGASGCGSDLSSVNACINLGARPALDKGGALVDTRL